MVNGKWVTRPRLRHSQRGPRKIRGCPTAMGGLLGPARMGRSGQRVAAPRANGDGHRLVSVVLVGGGGVRLCCGAGAQCRSGGWSRGWERGRGAAVYLLVSSPWHPLVSYFCDRKGPLVF